MYVNNLFDYANIFISFIYCYLLCLFTAAINVTKVIVNFSPSTDDVIPVELQLLDDNITEPTDLYQLTIVNVSGPNVVVGNVNTTLIIVNDDDAVVGEDN